MEGILDWFLNYKKNMGKKYDMSSFSNEQVPQGNAHDAINNEIIANTLEEIAHGSDWLGGQMLYRGETRGGDPRHILKYSTSLPTKELRETYYENLLREISENPQFADTLASTEVEGLIRDMQGEDSNMLQRLIDKIKGWF